MRIGVFADVHDHLDHLRQVVELFNSEGCELALFAGDLVSSFAVPVLRGLRCPVLGCFGDNEGNKRGVAAGFRVIGEIGEGPFAVKTTDGVKIVVTHMLRHVRSQPGEFDVCVYAHTHRARIFQDSWGRWFINPGEVSGWSYRTPSVALLDTQPLQAKLLGLGESPKIMTNSVL
ncbi:MAG: phosphodiesterase [Planctomycetaceae bacterium]|nr:MAG: phosphodiesterase [Planctomycetaceae bacterium]